MTDHQEIFQRIKKLLHTHLIGQINEFEDGTHLSIGDSGIWIAVDMHELTIGYGLSHKHYNPKYDNLKNALEEFFNLLTKRKRVTIFLKGDRPYKEKTEIEIDNNNFKEMGTALTWFFPFWRKTVENVIIENPLIEYALIENEIKNLKDLVI